MNFAKPLHMKRIWQFVIFIFLSSLQPELSLKSPASDCRNPVNHNLFIITTDGFRWQELFTGADSLLINNEGYTPDQETIKSLYWAPTAIERRKKLMPFIWNVIAAKGQLYGNRLIGNKFNVANTYAKSYPGYSEMLCGFTDPLIASNKKQENLHTNILEYLNQLSAFHGKVVAFTSWDVFPYILNEERSGLAVNSGYEAIENPVSRPEFVVNQVQQYVNSKHAGTRMDALTFLAAREYINVHRPRVVLLALGETDEFAHEKRYDLYLQQAAKVDAMLAELWHWVQTTEGYANNTTFLITTDHGRGNKAGKWTSHSEWISGSSSAWLALLGPGIPATGEVKENQQQYRVYTQEQLCRIRRGHL